MILPRIASSGEGRATCPQHYGRGEAKSGYDQGKGGYH